MKQPHLFLLHGLNPAVGERWLSFAKPWYEKKFGIKIIAPYINWKSKRTFLEELIRHFGTMVESLSQHGTIHLVGVSAGGSLALNIAREYPVHIKTVTNAYGWIDHSYGWLSQPKASQFTLFTTSLVTCEANLSSLPPNVQFFTLIPNDDQTVSPNHMRIPNSRQVYTPGTSHLINVMRLVTVDFPIIVDVMKYNS